VELAVDLLRLAVFAGSLWLIDHAWHVRPYYGPACLLPSLALAIVWFRSLFVRLKATLLGSPHGVVPPEVPLRPSTEEKAKSRRRRLLCDVACGLLIAMALVLGSNVAGRWPLVGATGFLLLAVTVADVVAWFRLPRGVRKRFYPKFPDLHQRYHGARPKAVKMAAFLCVAAAVCQWALAGAAVSGRPEGPMLHIRVPIVATTTLTSVTTLLTAFMLWRAYKPVLVWMHLPPFAAFVFGFIPVGLSITEGIRYRLVLVALLAINGALAWALRWVVGRSGVESFLSAKIEREDTRERRALEDGRSVLKAQESASLYGPMMLIVGVLCLVLLLLLMF